MKFKVDENLPPQVAAILSEAGHDAATVAEQKMTGSDDARLASTCLAEARVILTLDSGFADIRSYPPKDHSGIVVLRLQNQSLSNVISTMRRLLPLLESAAVGGVLWIVEEGRVRIRG